MTQYFAFLRAINVKNRYIKMDALRTAFEQMGFANVATYIQSGNVIFETDEPQPHSQLEQSIETHLKQTFGFDVPTMLRTAEQLTELATHAPFDDIDWGSNPTLYVSFLKTEPTAENVQKLLALSNEIEMFSIEGKHVFWLWRRDQGDGKVTNSRLERLLKVPATRRNISTIQKIAKIEWFSN